MMSIDDKESTKVVLEVVAVAQSNGLKLPREFGLLLKQAQYTHHCYTVLEVFWTQFRFLELLLPDKIFYNKLK